MVVVRMMMLINAVASTAAAAVVAADADAVADGNDDDEDRRMMMMMVMMMTMTTTTMMMKVGLGYLNLSSHEEVPFFVNHLDVRMALVVQSERARAPLLLDPVVHLGELKDSDGLAIVYESNGFGRLDARLVLGGTRQHDRNGLVDNLLRLVVVSVGVEVKSLEKLRLAHESLQRRRPTFGENL